jgi:ferredoxin
MRRVAFDTVCSDADRLGLACRGGFHPVQSDEVPATPEGRGIATVVLLGTVGAAHWRRFATSAEYADGAPHPLDRWSRRLIGELAARYGASALYPFGGPPWLPFQRWAQRAEPVHVSPLNILIHPRYGLWHAYRGALAFEERLEVPPAVEAPSPCESCAEKPCLTACPVSAIRIHHLDHDRCRAYLAAATTDNECQRRACRARASCPVGAEHRYGVEQSRFHMAAFTAR